MGNVIDFYAYEPHYRASIFRDKPATVTVLPVIRVERSLGERLAAVRAIEDLRRGRSLLDHGQLIDINTGPGR